MGTLTKNLRSTRDAIRRERAARIEAMFRRWESENVSDEPDWDPAAIACFQLGWVVGTRAWHDVNVTVD